MDYKKERRTLLRTRIYEYLIEHPCVDCEETNPVVLQFDHIDPEDKLDHVSRLASAGVSEQVLLEEIDKCEVRCANCHAVKTARAQRWYFDVSSF